MSNKTLDDDNHVSRYCKPSAVNTKGAPMAAAFALRKNEKFISVNWLECFDAPDIATAITYVREAFCKNGFKTRPAGKFAVLNVRNIKTAIYKKTESIPRIENFMNSENPSHSGIFSSKADNKIVAAALAHQLKPQDIHPGKIT